MSPRMTVKAQFNRPTAFGYEIDVLQPGMYKIGELIQHGKDVGLDSKRPADTVCHVRGS